MRKEGAKTNLIIREIKSRGRGKESIPGRESVQESRNRHRNRHHHRRHRRRHRSRICHKCRLFPSSRRVPFIWVL